MPGQLRPDSSCPKCGDPLLAIVDTTTPGRRIPGGAIVTREYFHDRWPGASPKARRKRRCLRKFQNYQAAQLERQNLETAALPHAGELAALVDGGLSKEVV